MRMNSVARAWLMAAEGGLLALLAAMLLDGLGAGEVSSLQHAGVALLIGVLLGAAIGVRRHVVWLIVADVFLVASTVVIAFTPVMSLPMRHLVRSDPLPDAPLDAIVVLSSGLMSDTTLGANGADRLLRGLELIHAGHAPRLVTTRLVWRSGDDIISSDPDQRRLIALVGAEALWTTVGPVATTRDEAVKSAQLLLPAGARRIAVVTSPSHTHRACATFEKVGFKVTCVPARERDHVTWHPVTTDDRLAAFRAYLYERLGSLKYRYKGWI